MNRDRFESNFVLRHHQLPVVPMLDRRFTSLSLSIVVSLGCAKVDLYSQLDEQQANEMMAILLAEDLSCEKLEGEESTWGLVVSQQDFSKAVNKLREQGYPKERFVGIGDVFKKSGLVSSPTEERIRFMHALSQELSSTISQIDGVLSARVHIVLPNNNPFGDTIQPSSASVFVKHRPGVDLTTQVPEITRLVVGSIEGLQYDAVSTVLFAADEVQPIATPQAAETVSVDMLSIAVAPESLGRLQIIIGSLAGAIVLLLLAGIYVLFGKSKRSASPGRTDTARAAARPMTA